ncbi:MAG: class I mannose-6-phosphate isomerase [Bacteroidota bacterium]
MKSSYDKYPKVKINGFAGHCQSGWNDITLQLKQNISENRRHVIVIETYPGVNDTEILQAIREELKPDSLIIASDAWLSPEEIDALAYPDVTDDRIFGYMTRLTIDRFFEPEKLDGLRRDLKTMHGLTVIYGTGAALICEEPDTLVYADMARWEIQLRMRRHEVSNLGANNRGLEVSRMYKRAYFVDWRMADRLKKEVMPRMDYLLDTNKAGSPRMVSATAFRAALEHTAERPFRVVPLFDPGPWGGQWMKEVCDLDRSQVNYAWCFDCVPEENSLLFDFDGTEVEIPSINLVFSRPEKLLGENVHTRFGAEFPIRFDFLDTMDGGNLSLQVHPTNEYIREHFGMYYTQDESYYMLDAGEDACVYLGLNDHTVPEQMIRDLEEAQQGLAPFNADKHAAKWPVKKHDHVLIPAGTIHCSGKNSMVLEISATPYIFTFKLWDWGRLGLDGLPRAINIGHGKKNINYSRREKWVEQNLINRIEQIGEGDGWTAERTGLYETEFIETHRHWFTKTVWHHTNGNLNVLNLVEGREVIVESPSGSFEPFVVHYAETFIVPAAVGEYTIRPWGEAAGTKCATIKAFVRP